MIFRSTRQILAAILIIALHSYSFALPNTAMLYPNGSVQVDGVPVNATQAVVEGQSISVANGAANLSFGMTSVMASQNTVFKFVNASELAISQGGLFVNTRLKVKTDLGECGSVTALGNGDLPANFMTKYEIQIRGDSAYIYARDLEVNLQAGGKNIMIQPQTFAVVHNFSSPRCTVSYYTNWMQAPSTEKAIIIGASVAPAVIIPTLFSQKLSAQRPGP